MTKHRHSPSQEDPDKHDENALYAADSRLDAAVDEALGALVVLTAQCRIALARSLRQSLLPTAVARSFLGNCLATHHPELLPLFEPGASAPGPALTPFTLDQLGDPGQGDLTLRLVTFDRDGILLPALLDSAWAWCVNPRSEWSIVTGFSHEGIRRLENLPLLPSGGRKRLTLTSPLRIRRSVTGESKRYILAPDAVTWDEILNAAIRRIGTIATQFGDGTPNAMDLSPAASAACGVLEAGNASLQHFQTHRLSSAAGASDRKRLDLSGVIGCREATLLPGQTALLNLASFVHIGHAASYGCGGLRVEAV